MIDPTVSMLRKNDMVDRVVFSGCEARRARYVKSHYADCQVLFNVSEAQYEQGIADHGAFVRSICRDAAEASCCGLNVYATSCSEELVAYAALRYLPVSVWTVDDVETMRHFLRLGVYSITTNQVAALRQLV